MKRLLIFLLFLPVCSAFAETNNDVEVITKELWGQNHSFETLKTIENVSCQNSIGSLKSIHIRFKLPNVIKDYVYGHITTTNGIVMRLDYKCINDNNNCSQDKIAHETCYALDSLVCDSIPSHMVYGYKDKNGKCKITECSSDYKPSSDGYTCEERTDSRRSSSTAGGSRGATSRTAQRNVIDPSENFNNLVTKAESGPTKIGETIELANKTDTNYSKYSEENKTKWSTAITHWEEKCKALKADGVLSTETKISGNNMRCVIKQCDSENKYILTEKETCEKDGAEYTQVEQQFLKDAEILTNAFNKRLQELTKKE